MNIIANPVGNEDVNLPLVAIWISADPYMASVKHRDRGAIKKSTSQRIAKMVDFNKLEEQKTRVEPLTDHGRCLAKLFLIHFYL